MTEQTGPAYIPERRISPRARRILAERRMADANWYRPSLSEQLRQVVGCLVSMAAILALAVFLWLTVVGVVIVVTR
jgi:hypothetical protein